MVLLQGVEETYQLEENSHYFYRIFASNSVGIVGTDEVDISMSFIYLILPAQEVEQELELPVSTTQWSIRKACHWKGIKLYNKHYAYIANIALNF